MLGVVKTPSMRQLLPQRVEAANRNRVGKVVEGQVKENGGVAVKPRGVCTYFLCSRVLYLGEDYRGNKKGREDLGPPQRTDEKGRWEPQSQAEGNSRPCRDGEGLVRARESLLKVQSPACLGMELGPLPGFRLRLSQGMREDEEGRY